MYCDSTVILQCAEPRQLTKLFIFSIIFMCANQHSLTIILEGGIQNGRNKSWKNETLDSALRRFKRSCQKAGVLSEVRKREHYEKPSVRRKKKSEAARKRKFKA